MKNKKLLLLLFLVLFIILVSLFFIIKNFKSKDSSNENDSYANYTPEEEISNKQLRETNITLYFVDSDNQIQSEKRLIDSADLLENPYKHLVELLISGPKTDSLKNVFPDNVKILDTKLENNCIVLNFSEELASVSEDTQKYNIVNTILNTLSQLNEVNSIKILVSGETNDNFNEEYELQDFYKNPLTKNE